MSETDPEQDCETSHISTQQHTFISTPTKNSSSVSNRQALSVSPLKRNTELKPIIPASVTKKQKSKQDDEKRFVEMIMKEQTRLMREKEKIKKAEASNQKQQPTTIVEIPEPPKIDANGYIDYKVDFVASLSEEGSNSWCEEISVSENDPTNVYEDEEEYDEEGGKPLKRFDKDDGLGLLQFIQKEPPKVVQEPALKAIEEIEQQIAAEPQQPVIQDVDNASNQSFSGKNPKHRIVINVGQTEYDVIKKVARKDCNWRLRYFEEDHEGAVRNGEHNQKLSPLFDLTWHDLTITADFLTKLHPWQKTNMYPGITCISKKNHLARNLMRMQKFFPEEYDFFPKTWVLPYEIQDLRKDYFRHQPNSKKTKVTYIVKPDSLSQGKGIFLSRSIDHILEITDNIKPNHLLEEHQIDSERVGYIVQQYIDRPHLIDDLKYDLRIYVFLYGVNPLRIYLHQMAFARFCTESYQRPNRSNIDNCFMHLTNYAINKLSDNYQNCEDEEGDAGHKRSLGAILQILGKEGCDVKKFMDEIKDIIVKTLITGQPQLSHLYRSCQPECLDNSMCFQILGFDVLIDSKFKPYLLEVNASPSFGTDSSLDYKIKKNVLADAFQMLNFSYKKRIKCIKDYQEKTQERILTGKVYKLSHDERERLKQEKLQERFKYESTKMSGYELIYPSCNKQKNAIYEKLLKKSNDIWDDFTTGKKKLRTQDTIVKSQNPAKLNSQPSIENKKVLSPQLLDKQKTIIQQQPSQNVQQQIGVQQIGFTTSQTNSVKIQTRTIKKPVQESQLNQFDGDVVPPKDLQHNQIVSEIDIRKPVKSASQNQNKHDLTDTHKQEDLLNQQRREPNVVLKQKTVIEVQPHTKIQDTNKTTSQSQNKIPSESCASTLQNFVFSKAPQQKQINVQAQPVSQNNIKNGFQNSSYVVMRADQRYNHQQLPNTTPVSSVISKFNENGLYQPQYQMNEVKTNVPFYMHSGDGQAKYQRMQYNDESSHLPGINIYNTATSGQQQHNRSLSNKPSNNQVPYYVRTTGIVMEIPAQNQFATNVITHQIGQGNQQILNSRPFQVSKTHQITKQLKNAPQITASNLSQPSSASRIVVRPLSSNFQVTSVPVSRNNPNPDSNQLQISNPQNDESIYKQQSKSVGESKHLQKYDKQQPKLHPSENPLSQQQVQLQKMIIKQPQLQTNVLQQAHQQQMGWNKLEVSGLSKQSPVVVLNSGGRI